MYLSVLKKLQNKRDKVDIAEPNVVHSFEDCLFFLKKIILKPINNAVLWMVNYAIMLFPGFQFENTAK